MNKKHQRGFTLIELLVVIAIIGILAALVLVALGNARVKANEARIITNVSQLRILAEVMYDANNASYLLPKSFETCFDNPSTANCSGDLENSIPALKADTLAAYSASALNVEATADTFCIEAALSATGGFVCVDQTGAFDKTNTVATCAEGNESCN